MKIIKNKKASIAPFPFLVGVMGILILLAILAITMTDYANLKKWERGPLGGKALGLFEAYQEADNALLYLDNAAKLSLQKATYDLSYNGFYPPGSSSCGLSGGHVWWSKGSAEKVSGKRECKAVFDYSCIPSKGDYNYFSGYFTTELDSHISSFNKHSNELKLIPNNYYQKLELIQYGNWLQVVGKAEEPIVINKPTIQYKFSPSFRENIDVDLIGNFKEITEKIKSLTEGVSELDEAKISDAIEAYNKEANKKLNWTVAFESDCSGNECYIDECTFEKETACEVKGKERPSRDEVLTSPDWACVRTTDGVEDMYWCERFSPSGCGGGDPNYCFSCKFCSFGCSGGTCNPAPAPDPDCETETVSVPGEFVHKYCEVTAKIDVKIVDDKYKLEGQDEGYKKFVIMENDKPVVNDYAYRFALNWVEIKDTECVRK